MGIGAFRGSRSRNIDRSSQNTTSAQFSISVSAKSAFNFSSAFNLGHQKHAAGTHVSSWNFVFAKYRSYKFFSIPNGAASVTTDLFHSLMSRTLFPSKKGKRLKRW